MSLVSEWNLKIIFFVRVVFAEKSLNRLVLKCFLFTLFEQIGIDMLSIHIFLIKMHEVDTTAEVYLEPFQTYMIGIFCEKS